MIEVAGLAVEHVRVRAEPAEPADEVLVAGVGEDRIGSSNVYEFRSPITSTSEVPPPVGSPASQSTSARAAFVRVRLQLPWPSPVSGSPMSSHAEPLDLRWLTATVTPLEVAVSSNVCASTGRLRVSMNRGSSAEVRSLYAPTGRTFAGL